MNSEKLEKLAKLVLKDLSECDQDIEVRFVCAYAALKNFLDVACKALPEHSTFFKVVNDEIIDYYPREACSIINHILAIIALEKVSEKKIKKMKIFESANEKLKQAGLSFRSDDYASVFHNLNTALELVLKDKLGIPTTITKINTSNIIDILVKHKVELSLYLAEARKRVLTIDNKIKHQGYSPSKIDCINGMKAMEELISRLRNKKMKLTEEVRNKIYEGL